MPDILIRDLDHETVERLKLHARLHNRSLQAEVAALLTDFAHRPTAEEMQGIFAEADRLTGGRRFPSAMVGLREDRDR